MIIKHTKIKDCIIIEPKTFIDKRGYFFESYNKQLFDLNIGYSVDFVQDNESYSSKNVLRGLHFQKGEHAQAKLVRVVKGEVLDVAVDLRASSETYGAYVSVILSEENKRQLFVPRGFAHGFLVLSDTAIFSYKCDNYYNKNSEGGIIYNDPALNIDWEISEKELIISEKDLELPKFNTIVL
ncbi:dTDP-4-dehydrorhamnose 3,5-epimerase [Winogradskyella luteola]|uniref:dTDP-4-dehydrorhamnose 3,5-epimerase n=1 Tax=Winogradskyella luteola TaxID=2828330 RepID=A0A9X1JPX4_9FLAO|nr:dTDP-4-dehydrorhamnose 3,5-epimerase [Winogradskyella luteola]MBV7269154.1 dTDP-4-dehydrorhamnose 3,5-epimerase [Winogradskyella luteola]